MQWQFSSIFPPLFFIAIFLLPLSRPPSHAFSWLLSAVLGIFLVNARVWWPILQVRRVFVVILLVATIVALAEATSLHLSSSLLPLVFFLTSLGVVPAVRYLVQVCGRRVVGLVLLGMILLWAQWGAAQFVMQADVGFNLAGESDISTLHIGVAKFSSGNQKILRAYGPFLHANTFGGVTLLGTLLLLLFFSQGKKFFSKNESHFFLSALIILEIALLASFSRSAIVGAVAAGAIWLIIFRGHWRKVSLLSGIVFLVFSPLLFFRSFDAESVALAERIDGFTWWKGVLGDQNSWRGMGLGGYNQSLEIYLKKYGTQVKPWQLAPVHSVPLLAWVELGRAWSVLILALTLGFVVWRRRQFLPWFFLGLLPVLPPLLLDHYFFTQPGPMALLLVWLVLSFEGSQMIVLGRRQPQ